MTTTPKLTPNDFSIHKMWDEFYRSCLSKNVEIDSIQYKEMRKAFFCGTFDMLNVLCSTLTEDESAFVLQKFSKELSDFIFTPIKK